MNGNKYNNTYRRGQVLLIVMMLLATLITVVVTIVFNSTTETQIAKLEEDSQKALSAAEAGIESIIKESAGTTIPLTSLGDFAAQGITGNAQVLAVEKATYVSPVTQQDEQFTFYLSEYPTLANPWTGALSVYFLSETGQCPSVEILVVTNTYSQQRFAFNTCSTIVENAALASNISTQIEETAFGWKTPTPLSITNGIVAFITVRGGKTRLGFKDENGGMLPSQGKLVESEARTQTGVVKKVQLFQTHPQIPSHFMTTSF